MYINLTPKQLCDFVYDFDYDINEYQAQKALDILETFAINYHNLTKEEILLTVDYVVKGEASMYKELF